MKEDPILTQVCIFIQRVFIFIVLTILQALALWFWFWTWIYPNEMGIIEISKHLLNIWPISINHYASGPAILICWVSLANSALIFIALGQWWKHRTDVIHRRGSRFVDERKED